MWKDFDRIDGKVDPRGNRFYNYLAKTVFSTLYYNGNRFSFSPIRLNWGSVRNAEQLKFNAASPASCRTTEMTKCTGAEERGQSRFPMSGSRSSTIVRPGSSKREDAAHEATGMLLLFLPQGEIVLAP